jgi:phosphatidylglycerol:prolipoprotein diacylglycerol transferase
MLIGLALGRIGCLLNGCCYGGACPGDALGLEFPSPSPPYMAQLHEGTLLGLELDDNDRVQQVDPASLAGRAGIRKGELVQQIRIVKNQVLLTAGEPGQKRRDYPFEIDELPQRSVAVYPSQLLSSINALLLCFFLCAVYPYRTRDGQVIALLLILYATSRFLLEIIRSDEPHVYFSLFTPAQTVSLVIFTSGVVLFVATSLFSRPLALPVIESRVNHGDKQT